MTDRERLRREAIVAELAEFKRAWADKRDAERRIEVARRALAALGYSDADLWSER